MRIALVTDETSDQLLTLAGTLAEVGHHSTVYTRRNDPDMPSKRSAGAHVTVRALPAGPAKPLAPDELREHIGTFGAALAEAWRRDRPALVHTHHWMPALAALVAARDVPTPLVRTFGPGSLPGALGTNGATDAERAKLERAICREASHLTVGCGEDRDELALAGIPPHNVTVVPTAVDLKRFSPHGPAYPRDGRPRLVSIGPSGPDGGADTAIHALRTVPDAELVIAGDLDRGTADKADKAERDRLMALAQRLGVDERVRVLDQVSADTIPALLRSADTVLCVPSKPPEGAPELAAMACGKPVIATAVGSLGDSVVDGVTGWFVQPGAPDELARAVRRILGDETWLQGFGMSARERAVARFSWPQVAAEISRVYAAILPAAA